MHPYDKLRAQLSWLCFVMWRQGRGFKPLWDQNLIFCHLFPSFFFTNLTDFIHQSKLIIFRWFFAHLTFKMSILWLWQEILKMFNFWLFFIYLKISHFYDLKKKQTFFILFKSNHIGPPSRCKSHPFFFFTLGLHVGIRPISSVNHLVWLFVYCLFKTWFYKQFQKPLGPLTGVRPKTKKPFFSSWVKMNWLSHGESFVFRTHF